MQQEGCPVAGEPGPAPRSQGQRQAAKWTAVLLVMCLTLLWLELSQEALDKLIAVGYDPVYGARPLKRAIQRWIENPLAQLILSGQFLPGTTVVASVKDDEIVFA